MHGTQLRLCLVSTPGLVRDTTVAALSTMPDVKVVSVVSGALSATQTLEHLHVDVLLLDANVPEGEMVALLYWIGENRPALRTVVATVRSSQQHQALAFGADAAVRRDELVARLPLLLGEFRDQDPLADATQSYDEAWTGSVGVHHSVSLNRRHGRGAR